MSWIWSEADTVSGSILPDVLLMMGTTQWPPSSHIIIKSSLTAHLSQVLLSKIQSNAQNLAWGLFLLIVIRIKRKQQHLRHITIIWWEPLDWGIIYMQTTLRQPALSDLCQGQSEPGSSSLLAISCWALTGNIMLVRSWLKWTWLRAESDSFFTEFAPRRECMSL